MDVPLNQYLVLISEQEKKLTKRISSYYKRLEKAKLKGNLNEMIQQGAKLKATKDSLQDLKVFHKKFLDKFH